MFLFQRGKPYQIQVKPSCPSRCRTHSITFTIHVFGICHLSLDNMPPPRARRMMRTYGPLMHKMLPHSVLQVGR